MATRDPRGDGTGAVAMGGGTEPRARPAAVHLNASSPTRPDVPPMLGNPPVRSPAPADRRPMAPWILAHGNGLDDLAVLAFGSSLAVAVRLLVARRRSPDDPEEPTSE